MNTEEKYIQKQCPVCLKPFWNFASGKDSRVTCSQKCFSEHISIKKHNTKLRDENEKMQREIGKLSRKLAELAPYAEMKKDEMKYIQKLKDIITSNQYVIESYRQWFADRTHIMPCYDLPKNPCTADCEH